MSSGTETTFSENQNTDAYPDGFDKHFWFQARNAIIEKYLSKFVGRNRTVLDIGCGRGFAVKYLRQKGIACFGSELSNSIPVFEAEKFVFSGRAYETLPADFLAEVEAVLLLDVLEHIADPKVFLENLKTHLPSLRYVIATVPSRKELWSNYDDHYGHFLRYHMSDLKNLFRSSWEIKAMFYFFNSLYFPMWLSSKLKKGRTIQQKTPRFTFLHSLIGWFIRIEEILMPRWVPGTSLFIVAEVKS